MTSPYTLTENASLAACNTFRVAARAPLLADVNDPQALPEVLQLPALRGRPLLLLGEGSNILFARDPDMPVLTVTARGIRVLADGNTSVQVRAAAGEHWHDLVRWSLQKGLCGLENLSLIPGTVGAAPIQNIGAYGAELADVLLAVEAFDRNHGEFVRLEAEHCEFSYRQSVFKRHPDRWIITTVELELRRDAPLKLDYSGVRDELTAMGIAEPTALDVSNAVCRLRRRKLPDPAVIGNAGSFFKNPLISAHQAQLLQQEYPRMPVYSASEERSRKLSAAWLIEQCGWKGFREGDAGVSDRHALVLVNHGHATGAELWSLAQRIVNSVEQKFAITLEPEPRIIR